MKTGDESRFSNSLRVITTTTTAAAAAAAAVTAHILITEFYRSMKRDQCEDISALVFLRNLDSPLLYSGDLGMIQGK
ncbi:Hypothetical predicted protein [Octopus vulgaris]|uniref:Uncharacterized protein n=1 Tax=Octopus vulgaris TaxID=6645 RepID=A0AA36F659_OCTVU|nr:Hypothetical predicted protein [Octopus vulgaris]